ncbi:protein TRC8 homolog [Uloborus diversus]|uniref:protein TRC8 homolog n=1 Tax=Uloborus diversus TaxID=327109 RepID=UPI00240943CC|nr:protein TRC8 homolog [Uloborus diversus]
MSAKSRVVAALDILLRTVPLFLLDAILNYEWGISKQTKALISEFRNEGNSSNSSWLTTTGIENFGFSLFCYLMYAQAFITVLFVFLFNIKQLLSIYIRISSIGIIFLAYELNTNYIAQHSHAKYTPDMFYLTNMTVNYLVHFILAILFFFTNSIRIKWSSVVWLLFFMPTATCAFDLPFSIIKISPVLSATGCIILAVYNLWVHGLQVCETVYNGINWCHDTVEIYGLYTMIETHWIDQHIPQVFLTFWLLRSTHYVTRNVFINYYKHLSVSEIMKCIISHGSENIVALLGMTSVVSLVCQLFGYSIQLFLQVNDPAEKNIGNAAATLFLILSIQNGITRLDPTARYIRTSRNLCLIYTALLHFVYNILHPVLLSISASKNPSPAKHIRALMIGLFLIITPATILIKQWNMHDASTWLLALTAFMMELIIKTMVSIFAYILFIIDSYKNGLWENLEDYIYYLKVAANTLEIVLGFYLFLNGLWIFIFESAGVIRACMMLLHAYFNVYKQAKNEWQYYLARRSAAQKIQFLPEATPDQLKSKNNCAICFQELNTARVTKCNHLFHGVCIRKWLNVQATCPLCHTHLCSGTTSTS